ncbi:MAG: metal-dependent hydrolase [Acidobacteria bacterium]|nr:metal-dependent hydrolase [Acidobacteriota bacterium]
MVHLTWLGHSTFELKLSTGEVYLIDPWLENPKAPANYELTRLDGILLSHGHSDHIGSVLSLSARFGCPVVGIDDLIAWLGSKGATNGVGMNKGGSYQLGPLTITLVFASHSSTTVEDGKFVPLGDACGIVITLPDGRAIYFAGDTDVFGDMRLIADLYQPQVSILPIGDFYTMGPKQAALACRMLRSQTIIPMHYGTFPPLTGTPEALAELISDLPHVKVLAPNPGVTIEL